MYFSVTRGGWGYHCRAGFIPASSSYKPPPAAIRSKFSGHDSMPELNRHRDNPRVAPAGASSRGLVPIKASHASGIFTIDPRVTRVQVYTRQITIETRKFEK